MNLKVITTEFLEKYEICWKIILEDLEITHKQLQIGNRLRPQICFWGYLSTLELNGNIKYDFMDIAKLSTNIELIHKASLLLDDWIDNDSKRHGHETFHVKHSPEHTVLLSIKMIVYALKNIKNSFPKTTILPHNYNLCLENLIDILYSMANGALDEILLSTTDILDYEKVEKITQLQTSKIIGNSMLLGYYFGCKDNENKNIVNIFQNLGDQCGFIFQIMNDIEVFSAPSKLIEHKGNINTDIQLHRKNLAIAKLYSLANKKDKSLMDSKQSEDIIKLIKKYKIIPMLEHQCLMIFNDMTNKVSNLTKYGVSDSWNLVFIEFLEQVKKTAQARLR